MVIIVNNAFVLREWILYIVVSLDFKTFHVIILMIYKFKYLKKNFLLVYQRTYRSQIFSYCFFNMYILKFMILINIK